MSLHPSRSSNDAEEDSITSEVRRILSERLPAELEEIYGFEVKTRVIAVRQGSLVVFFGALVSALGIFSSYSDFFESIALIKKHSKRLLGQRLAGRFGGGFDVSIEVEYPSVPDPDDLSPWRHMRKRLGPEFHELMSAGAWPGLGATSPRRDGFFWFLLASTILLLVLLGLLVAGAVWKTYFA